MDELALQSAIDEAIKQYVNALENGGNDLASDNKIRGRILGLREAQAHIHEAYIRLNNGDSTDADEFP